MGGDFTEQIEAQCGRSSPSRWQGRVHTQAVWWVRDRGVMLLSVSHVDSGAAV